jgi:hypothetical protein
MLMVVSIFAAPYCFLYDQGLVIPGLLEGAYRTRSRTLLVILALSSIVVEAELICGVNLHSVQFLWTGATWLAWYLLAIWLKKASAGEPEKSAAVTAPVVL